MKTILFVTVLLSMIGCGGESSDAPREAATDASVDVPSDACVAAQGNCGCVIEETAHYIPGQVTPVVTTVVVCPDR